MNHIEIADRLYSYHGDIASELSFEKSKTYLCPLDYLNCVSIIGDNAKNFLQGQLSCDVNLVDEDHYLTGLLCSLKGRIIAMMDVIHCHDYQLVIEKDITERTLSSLKNVAKLSQVQMKPSNTYRALGIIGNSNHIDLPISPPENNKTLHQNQMACIYKISDNLSMLLVKNEVADNLINTNQERIKGSLLWHYLSLKHNRPSIYPTTQGEFLPHRLDLHLQSGMISLNKGCFRGQEIIARTHYRAKLKHKYYTYVTDTQPQLKDSVVVNNENIGEIIDWCPINEKEFLIATSVKKEFIDRLENPQ